MAFIFGGKHFNIWHLLPSEQQNRKIITFAKMKSMQATAKITLNESYFDELMLSHRQPSRISHADGYVSLDENGDATFYYYLTDHLGNVRSVITPDADGKPQVEQANDYFTFGMSFESRLPYLTKSGSGSNKHKYNGKEEQEMPGKWLDYGARMYDPIIGRFPSSDPISESFYHVTPYNYAENEPVGSIDLWGLQ